MTPRNYLSWTQYSIFKKSPEQYRKKYLLGESGYQSKEQLFGKQMADIREGREDTEDELIEHIKTLLTYYPKTDYEMTATVKIGRSKVILLGVFDGADLKKHIIGEDKTGRLWTQKQADDWKQLTWYAYIYWLNKKIIPKLQLNWIETKEENGQIVATGNIKTFETARTIKDFIKLQVEINKVWTGIVGLCEKEWTEVL